MTMSEGLSPVSCSLPCFPEEEKEIVKELIRASEANLKEGDVFCLISSRWWREWKEYVRFDVNMGHSNFSKKQKEGLLHTCRPGQIDNSELILNGMNNGDFLDLRGNLLEGEDYDLVPLEVWKKLVEWYRGGPEIPRKLLSEGFFSKNFSVEVYPLCLCLIDARDNSERTIRISRKASVGELYKMVCTLFELDQAKVIIWDYFKKNKSSMLTKMDQSLDEATLHMDQEILLEVQLDGLWPSNCGMDSTGNEMALVPIEPSRSSMSIAGGPTISNGHSTRLGSYFLQGNNFSSSQRDSEDVDDILRNETKVDGRGLTGLHNLGNTCFMNSAIQCLVHTSPLLEFFLQDYSEEINKKNPLGMQGELAIAFGELLRALWSSGRSSVAPRAFKGKLARFAPQFSGYNQHDSQELLAFLLDGLHEDLNRVRNKPYIEAKDANGRPDEEFADECWEYHRARNDSVIVDVCQGQYKSTLVCPVCRKVSVTFDPFMYLSLPMPSAIMRKMTVTVFSGDGSALPMPYTVTVSKNGCCRDLVQALSTACCLKSYEALLIAEVHEHQIHRYIENMFEPLSGIKDDDYLVAYRLPSNYNKLRRIDIFHRNVERCAPELLYSFSRKLLGTPLVTCLPEGANSGADIHVAVRTVLTPLLRAKALLPSHRAKTINMNGCGPSLDAIALTDNHTLPNGKDLPASNMDIEPTANRSPSFQLSMNDQRGISGIAIRDNNTFLAPESSIKLFLDWSQREHDLYDASYLEDLPGVHHSGNKKTRQEPVSLFSCLDAFLKEEPLGPEDMWYCPACKEHRQATKKLDLWRLPEILVVHLKRFSYNRFMKNKLETFVNFPVHNLDLTKYVKKPSTTESHLYELYAISNHYGGLGGGHYTAYAKLIDEGRWYHFDDSHVSPVGEESIKTSAAYVLFYQRVK